MRDDVRARARAGAWVAGIAGFLVMVVSGLRSGPYLPTWQDPDDGPPCSLFSAGCPDDLDAALRHLWWWTAVGGALLLLAVAAHTWCLPSRRDGAAPRVPVAVRAVCLGGGCLVLSAGLGWGAVFALILTPHLLPPAIAAYWLVQAVVVSAVEQTSGAASPRRASVTGMVSAAVATGLTAWLFFDQPWDVGFRLPLTDGSLVAAGVLAAAVLSSPWSRGWVRAGAGLLTVAAAAGVVALAWTVNQRRPAPVAASSTSSSAPTVPSLAAPSLVPPPPVVPATTPPAVQATTTPPPVRTSIPCASTDLDWQITGFDAALGARFASLVVTNVTGRACYVDGFPVVVLAQGGRPLDLAVSPGSSTSPGTPGRAQRVGIAPGGTALSGLYWRTYGGLADAATPQSVSAALAGGTPSPVPVAAPPGHGPAPFDIADGGAWQVGNWIPGTG